MHARRYPHGPARNQNSVQRGSVQYLSSYPGDPTTPGYPAYENSTRTEGENIPHIPSLPLSWANARILLNEISEGGLNRTVSFVNHGKSITRTPTQVAAHTSLVDTRVIPIWNTMGVIPGHIKDEVIVIGNHRDGQWSGFTLACSELIANYSLGDGCHGSFFGNSVCPRSRSRLWCASQERLEAVTHHRVR